MKKTGIIGFGRAGYAAAENLRKSSYDGEIHVFSDTDMGPQNPMLTTYYASEKIPEEQVTPFGKLEEICDSLRIAAHINSKVIKVLPESMELLVKTEQGREETYAFDDIVIATGSEPIIPNMQGVHSKNVVSIRSIGDAKRMHSALLAKKKALVVGASMIGIKVVQALREFSVSDVTMVDFAPVAFPTAVLEEASGILHNRIEEKGVRLKLKTGIKDICEIDDETLEVEFTTGEKETYDVVFLCMGTRSRIGIVEHTGIETDRAILVDGHQRTNYDHIYAVGDCACAYEMSTGEKRNVSLWANAAEQGRIAGENIAGKDTTYGGNIFCNITYFWDTDFVSIGNNRAQGKHISQKGKDWYFFAVVGEDVIECVNIIDNPELAGTMKNLMQKAFKGERSNYPMVEYNLNRFGLGKEIIDIICAKVAADIPQKSDAPADGGEKASKERDRKEEASGQAVPSCDPADIEKKIKAKIPGKDTGIEIKKTFCDICTPINHCGIDAYVKDGTVLKIEGTIGHPMNNGKLCTKGACNRAYIYRKDRLKTPLRRVGQRGEGKFEEISWEEAISEIAEKMSAIKAQYGANSVLFYSGYAKSYRFMLQRLAHDFGSVNYATESSACFTAGKMAWTLNTGKMGRPDLENANLFVAWASPTHHARFTNGNAVDAFHRRGGTIISIDPRKTTISERDADLHLQIKPGTDGLLANGIAGYIIRKNKHDKEYIEKYVHGFEEYAKYVCSLDLDEVSRVTTIPKELIIKAADMIAGIKPMSVENSPTSLMHQANGTQAIRAIIALSIITGNYNTAGGNTCLDYTFCEQSAGFHTLDEEFAVETVPADFDKNRIGADKFPVWNRLVTQAQACDFSRQVIEETPYPIKCVYAHGMNHYMFPNTAYTEKALEKLDFFVDVDLFMTDTAKYADILLPACSSFEREEFKVYPGGFAAYYLPAISRLYDARPDFDIISQVAKALKLDDEYLAGGYRTCLEYVLKDTGLDIEELSGSDLPVKVDIKKPGPYEYLNSGCNTPSGKLELFSEIIAEYADEYKLNPLPVYEEPALKTTDEYPFVLQTGVRIPGAIHTRLNKVNWARALRPDPMIDISFEDAEELGITKGEDVVVYNENGKIYVKANPSVTIKKGQACMFHGYSEANVALLLYKDIFDPYSGFPNYKSVICNIKKAKDMDVYENDI